MDTYDEGRVITHSSDSQRIAPVRHTVILAGLFLLLAVAGASGRFGATTASGAAGAHQTRVPLYVSLIAAEWGLVYFVWKGALKPRGETWLDFIGGRWTRPTDAVRDVLLAAGVWTSWSAADHAWQHWLGIASGSSVRAVLPVTAAEIAAWLVLSVSAGIAEEVVFRGYFQRQFRALGGSRTIAIGLQAVLFGVSHGYQGLGPCVRITGYGLLFGVVAEWRTSLRPGMMAHAWTDICSGLVR